MPRYDSSDGSTLYYEDIPGTGKGIPVILLAGGAARHPSYLGELAGLGEERRLIVPHLRGVGLSEASSDPQRGSWWGQAVDVEQLRIHLGLDRVALVAHSAGTRLAIAYAAQFPRNVAALVLITPPAGYLVDEPTDVPTLIDRRRGDTDFDRAILALRAGPATSAEDDFTAWQRDSAAAGYATWNETGRAHAQIGRWSRAAATAYFSVDPPRDLAARLLEVTAPVLVIAGAQDCLVGFEPVKAVARMFLAGQSVTIEACGHYPWVEQPTAFRRAMQTFLEYVSSSLEWAQFIPNGAQSHDHLGDSSMDITFTALDLPADHAALVQFMMSNEFPFHINARPTRTYLEQKISAGAFGGPDHASFWVQSASEGRVGLAILEDLLDDAPLFDLRLSSAARGRGLGARVLQALTAEVFQRWPNVNRFEGQTREDNVAMRKTFLRSGFIKEAHYREGWPVTGAHPLASVAYAILRRDWESGETTNFVWEDLTV